MHRHALLERYVEHTVILYASLRHKTGRTGGVTGGVTRYPSTGIHSGDPGYPAASRSARNIRDIPGHWASPAQGAACHISLLQNYLRCYSKPTGAASQSGRGRREAPSWRQRRCAALALPAPQRGAWTRGSWGSVFQQGIGHRTRREEHGLGKPGALKPQLLCKHNLFDGLAALARDRRALVAGRLPEQPKPYGHASFLSGPETAFCVGMRSLAYGGIQGKPPWRFVETASGGSRGAGLSPAPPTTHAGVPGAAPAPRQSV